MSATATVVGPGRRLRGDSAAIWHALVNATATWTAIDPENFQDIDWKKFVSDAQYHGVMPIVSRRVLESRLAKQVDPDVKEQFRRYARNSLMRGFPLVAEVRRITSAFVEAGVPIIPYKGPVLAEHLWGDALLRECVDLDFLVERNNVDRAGEMLDQLGYSRVTHVSRHLRPALLKNASEEQFRNRDGGLLLELQWSPAPLVFGLRFDVDGLWQRAQQIACDGEYVLGPAPEDLLMLLSIHGWKHNWGRLIWLGDVAQLLRVSPMDWDFVAENCKRDRNLRLVALALQMSNRVFGTGVPEQFAFADSALNALVDELVGRLRDVRACEYRDWHRCMLLARDNGVDQVRQLTRFFLTPGLGDYAACDLPPWAASGYRVIRLGRLLMHRQGE